MVNLWSTCPSLGMLQNGFHNVYRSAAQACAKMPHVQMVLSLGRKGVTDMLDGLLENLSNGALIYDYSLSFQLLKKAAIMVCIGGMNTILEALQEGVPMVTIPLGSDQSGNSARAQRRGVLVLVTCPHPIQH